MHASNLKGLGHGKTLSDDLKINKYTVESDEYDIFMFKELLKNTNRLKETHAKGMDVMEQFKELHNDVFSALYKYAPKLNPSETIQHTHRLNEEVMKQVLETPKYKEIRTMTRLDKLSAAIGTEVLGEQVLDLMKKLKEEFEELMEQLKQAAEAAEKAEAGENGDGEAQGQGEGEEAGEGEDNNSQGTGTGEGQETPGDPNGKGKNSKKYTLDEAKKKLEEINGKIEDLAEKKIKPYVNLSVAEALTQITKTSELISNWGLGKDPTFQKTGYQEKLKLLEKLRTSPKLKEIADLVGRFRLMAIQAQKEKIKHGFNELDSVHFGDSLEKLVSSEYTKLALPELEIIFDINLVEKSLLNYTYESKEKKHKGPIVACIDSSGSMGGTPELWAKAVMMGILEIARLQKRDVRVIHFSSGTSKGRLKYHQFNYKDPSHIHEIIDMVEYFEGGGTEFQPPLDLARDFIEKAEGYDKADIIFITDGESAVKDSFIKDFNEFKKTTGTQVYSILINSGQNSDSTLKEFSDKIVKCSELSTLTQRTTALDLFKHL